MLNTILGALPHALTASAPAVPFVESVEKFDGLVAGHTDAGLSREIKDAVPSLESIQVRDLVKLLSYAKAPGREARDVGRNLPSKETA